MSFLFTRNEIGEQQVISESYRSYSNFWRHELPSIISDGKWKVVSIHDSGDHVTALFERIRLDYSQQPEEKKDGEV